MVNLTLGTNTEKKSVIIDVNTTLADALAENNVNTQGSALYLNGQMIAGADTQNTLAELGVADGSKAMLIAVVKSDCAFEASFKDNVLKVITDITKESVEKGISNFKVTDNKGNEVYAVEVDQNGAGGISEFGLVGNTFIDDKLALTIVLPMNTKQADVEKQYGEKILNAKKYSEQIASEAKAKEDEITALFE